jgi:two-component system, chemotaxis family, protein-glutamate methylesterase/glutaminase
VIRVLVVDDSTVVRRVFRQVLSAQADIEVVGEAPDPYVARDLIVSLKPDVVTLDIEMPRMDGLTFLKKLMKFRPIPVVIASTLTVAGGQVALEAMASGAVEVICKPGNGASLADMADELIGAVRAAAQSQHRVAKIAAMTQKKLSPTHDLIAVGASTGGTVAIEGILEALPAECPGMVLVQHMPAFFTGSFAARLARLSRMRVQEAKDGDLVEAGLALVAPGDKQLVVRKSTRGYVVGVMDGPKVSGHRPSVDVLFRSVAKAAAGSAVGVILTGMGADGAHGLLEMRQAGARTLGQDAESSVVYGMPRAAFELGGVEEQVSLGHLPERILAVL